MIEGEQTGSWHFCRLPVGVLKRCSLREVARRTILVRLRPPATGWNWFFRQGEGWHRTCSLFFSLNRRQGFSQAPRPPTIQNDPSDWTRIRPPSTLFKSKWGREVPPRSNHLRNGLAGQFVFVRWFRRRPSHTYQSRRKLCVGWFWSSPFYRGQ